MTNPLHTVLQSLDVRLEPLTEAHREALRAACPEDDAVWEIYPIKFAGADFDACFDRYLATADYVYFIAHHQERVVGITAFMPVERSSNTIEIGNTYFTPSMRGTGYNAQVKSLMIDHAIACGYTRIELRVDVRNTRSQAAVRKLGAVYEGTLRKNRITWTGHVRDTAVFSLLADEWRGR